MPDPEPSAPGAASTCTSIARFGGWRCERAPGHKERLHCFERNLWADADSVSSPDEALSPLGLAARPRPAHPPALDAVLRLASRSLIPHVGSTRAFTLDGLAFLVRELRAASCFDVETTHAIESWLAVYEGKEASR